jgi:hypothetical protein
VTTQEIKVLWCDILLVFIDKLILMHGMLNIKFIWDLLTPAETSGTNTTTLTVSQHTEPPTTATNRFASDNLINEVFGMHIGKDQRSALFCTALRPALGFSCSIGISLLLAGLKRPRREVEQ